MATLSPKITISSLNGDVVRDMTAGEISELNAEREAIAERLEMEANEQEQRAIQKAALLERLGITEDEAKLLLA